ncbi:hypothetical protein Tco_0553725 [Tanacetum coccineum]
MIHERKSDDQIRVNVEKVAALVDLTGHVLRGKSARNVLIRGVISGISYERIRGTYTGKPMHLACSNSMPVQESPTVGLTLDSIASAFSLYGTVKGVYPADESGCRVIVSYDDETSTQTALNALDRKPCSDLRAQEEEQLLAAVDARPWHNLGKRMVQNYGYEFYYNFVSPSAGSFSPKEKKRIDEEKAILKQLI